MYEALSASVLSIKWKQGGGEEETGTSQEIIISKQDTCSTLLFGTSLM